MDSEAIHFFYSNRELFHEVTLFIVVLTELVMYLTANQRSSFIRCGCSTHSYHAKFTTSLNKLP